jgi:glycosyltransferase involved in cell wall biosynthesis
MKMRIAVWHNLPSGGGKRALSDHIRGLLARGHKVEAWCPPTADRSYLPLDGLIKEHYVPLDWRLNTAHGRAGRVLAAYHNENAVGLLNAMDRHCRLCAQEINAGGFDLLFANACQYLRVTAIGRYVNIPKVIYLQEPYRWLYEAMPTWPWAAVMPPEDPGQVPQYCARLLVDAFRTRWRRIQAREESRNAKAFDAILVNSAFSRESVLRAYGLDARICYLGVDTQFFTNHATQQQNMVLGIGAFVPEKNIEFIIKALSYVAPPRPRLCWIGNVGDIHYVERLVLLASRVNVDFEPLMRIEDNLVVDLLNQAMMFVCAPRLEPFGLAPLEANACGIPVIAVAEGGVRETIVDGFNGLLVENDPRVMAAAIQRLIENPTYACQLGQNGRRLVEERWSLKAAMDRLEDRFRQVLDRPLGRPLVGRANDV